MYTDTLGRRSRFVRNPTGKRIVVSERDINTLQLLYRYRFLRSPQIVAFLRPKSDKRLTERLGDLFHETALINRPPAQWRYGDPRCTSIAYELTPKGLALLGVSDMMPLRATTLSRRGNIGRTQQFAHAMMIVDTLTTIELATRDLPDQRFVSVDEILKRAPENTQNAKNPLAAPVTIHPHKDFPDIITPWKTHVIPDGLFGIEYLVDNKKRYRFWALECERTSPARRSHTRASSLMRKRAAYQALISSQGYKAHWGIPNLKLHLVTQKDIDTPSISSFPNIVGAAVSRNDCPRVRQF